MSIKKMTITNSEGHSGQRGGAQSYIMLCSIGYEEWIQKGRKILNKNGSVLADVNTEGRAIMMSYAPEMYRLLKNIIYTQDTTEKLIICTHAQEVLDKLDQKILNLPSS